jgi:hypothetical protein
MSIFDRKRSTPEPDIDFEPEPPRYQQPQAQPQSPPRPQAQPQPEPQVSRPAAPAASAPPSYGIQKAIELMRSLPADNIPLVVQVVRTTLESTNVDVPSIIEDAKAKRARIVTRIEGLRREIANFEEEIAARREEIVALDADHAETKLVQERLEMSIKPREDKPGPTPVTVSLSGESGRPSAPRPAVRPPATG